MAAERAFTRPRETITCDLRLEGFGDALTVRHRDGDAEGVAELCPEDRPDAFKAEADLSGDGADEKRCTRDQVFQIMQRRDRRKRVKSLGPEHRIVDRFEESGLVDLPLVQCDNRRCQLALKALD